MAAILPPVCCAVPPVESDYAPVGLLEQIDDLPVYTVGPKDSKRAVIVVYDIMGFHQNTKQFADILANTHGFRVVMPDFFRGKPCTPEKMALGRDKLMEWIGTVGNWDVISPDLAKVKQYLTSSGFQSVGIVGFCWGAKIAITATGKDSWYAGAALIHPSQLILEDAQKAQGPILLLPSKDEADLSEFFDIIKSKPFGAHSYHHRFDDMHHGWVAARGNFTDPLNKQRATEALQLSADFFQQVLKV